MLTAYQRLGFRMEDYPNAYHQYANEITLPLYSQLRQEQVDYIIAQFTEILAKVRPNEREEIFGTGSSKVG